MNKIYFFNRKNTNDSIAFIVPQRYNIFLFSASKFFKKIGG